MARVRTWQGKDRATAVTTVAELREIVATSPTWRDGPEKARDASILICLKQADGVFLEVELSGEDARKLFHHARQVSLGMPPRDAPTGLLARFGALAKAAGDAWDDVDAEEYVRQVRGGEELRLRYHNATREAAP